MYTKQVMNWLERRLLYCKEGNILFNNVLSTFYLRLYSIRHTIKDHSDSERTPAATTTWAILFD